MLTSPTLINKNVNFLTHFANIGKSLISKIPENAHLKEHFYRVTPTIDTIDYHPDMLLKFFNKVFKPGKSCGHDNVSSKDIQLIGKNVLNGIHYIAKSSFSSCKFPSKYKIAKVRCIHKKGSKLLCENYRPISLLCLTGKLLEAVAAFTIDNHIYNNNLIKQWGFRKGRSPELHLINITT